MVLLLVILAGVAIGVGAYHAGVAHGLAESGDRWTGGPGGRARRVVGFFPFGIFLFPLFFFLIFGLLRAAFWGRRWRGYGHRRRTKDQAATAAARPGSRTGTAASTSRPRAITRAGERRRPA